MGGLDEIKFFCDAMLGKLGRWLRILGYDTLIANPRVDDTTILRICRQDSRILLTRDRELSRYGLYINSENLVDQLSELMKKFSLVLKEPRCPLCNSELVKKEHPLGFEETSFCPLCGKYFWKGSHWKHILEIFERASESQNL